MQNATITVMLCLFSLCLPAIGALEVKAATIERYDDPVMGCNILVSGKIEVGDAARLKQMIDSNYDALSLTSFGQRVCFNSPGGNMLEGLAMATVIARTDRGLGTAVGMQHICESACALAFMAGWYTPDHRLILIDRVIHPTAKLGFHAPNLEIPIGSYSEREVQRSFQIALGILAELSSRRVEEGYIFAESLITSLLVTPFSEMRYIETIEDASRWQIAVGPVGMFTESVPLAVANICFAVARGLLDHQHPSHFSINEVSEEVTITSIFENSLTAETRRGFDLQNQSGLPCRVTLPTEMWRQDETEALPIGDAAFNSDGQWEENWTGWGVVWPYQSFPGDKRIADLPAGSLSQREYFFNAARTKHRSADLFETPSWCENATSPAELTICSDETLSQIDIDVAQLFNLLRGNDSIRQIARERLSLRNACGGDAACILAVTKETLRIFSVAESGAKLSLEIGRVGMACWLTSPTARITNVNEYVNLRRQPDFSASVIRQVPLGEQVRALRTDNITVIGQERDRQSCIRSCQAFGQNAEDQAARERVQQCIDDNMLWYEITDARDNRGWVSRKFLEEGD